MIDLGNYDYRDELIYEIKILQRFYGLETRATGAELDAMSVDDLEQEHVGTRRDGWRKRHRAQRERPPLLVEEHVSPFHGQHISQRSG